MLGLNAHSVSNGIVSTAVAIYILPHHRAQSVLSLSPLSTVQIREKILSLPIPWHGFDE